MFINKIGSYHLEYGINNQDSGFKYSKFGLIVDGCSEGKHSEVGAKLYAKKLLQEIKLKEFQEENNGLYPIDSINQSLQKVRKTQVFLERVFEKVLSFITFPVIDYSKYLDDVLNYLLFTILYLEEDARGWTFLISGDGYVITQNYDENIEFLEIDHSSTPNYLAYKFLKSAYVDCGKCHNNIDFFKSFRFEKKDYSAIGIASDGLKYILSKKYESKFKTLLLKRKDFLINRFINKINYDSLKKGGTGVIKDDLTISMR